MSETSVPPTTWGYLGVWCYHLNRGPSQYLYFSLSLFIKHSEVKITNVCVRQTPTQGSRIWFVCCIFFNRFANISFFHWVGAWCYHKHVILNSWCSQLRHGCGYTADGCPQVTLSNNDLTQRVVGLSLWKLSLMYFTHLWNISWQHITTSILQWTLSALKPKMFKEARLTLTQQRNSYYLFIV